MNEPNKDLIDNDCKYCKYNFEMFNKHHAMYARSLYENSILYGSLKYARDELDEAVHNYNTMKEANYYAQCKINTLEKKLMQLVDNKGGDMLKYYMDKVDFLEAENSDLKDELDTHIFKVIN